MKWKSVFPLFLVTHFFQKKNGFVTVAILHFSNFIFSFEFSVIFCGLLYLMMSGYVVVRNVVSYGMWLWIDWIQVHLSNNRLFRYETCYWTIDWSTPFRPTQWFIPLKYFQQNRSQFIIIILKTQKLRSLIHSSQVVVRFTRTVYVWFTELWTKWIQMTHSCSLGRLIGMIYCINYAPNWNFN